MKKVTVMLLILTLILSMFAGCQNADINNEEENKNTEATETTKADESETTEETEPEINETLTGELTEIINKLYEINTPGLKVESKPVDFTNADMVKYNTGLDDISKVKEAVVSEAMITSQAYSLVLVRVNDKADVEDVANAMLDGINTRKWICVEADDLQIVTYDDLIMLIMVSSQLEESVTSDKIVDAFEEVCGDAADIKLTK